MGFFCFLTCGFYEFHKSKNKKLAFVGDERKITICGSGHYLDHANNPVGPTSSRSIERFFLCLFLDENQGRMGGSLMRPKSIPTDQERFTRGSAA